MATESRDHRGQADQCDSIKIKHKIKRQKKKKQRSGENTRDIHDKGVISQPEHIKGSYDS